MTQYRRLPLFAALAIGVVAFADPPDADPPPTEETTPPVQSEGEAGESGTESAPPSLDDLLGIEEDREDDAENVAEREAQEELQRKLDAVDLNGLFAEVLEKMNIVADQLVERFDTGLGTQRAQEDVLAKLDQLLDAAKQQQPSSGGGGSSQSAPSPSSPSAAPGQKGGQGQSAKQSSGDSRGGDPPPTQQGSMNSVFDEQRTEWGSLPQRVRDMLLQGRKEKFSSLYEQLTREYYQRLAEEGSR